MDWITGISKAIDYIEEHITEPTDYARAAKIICRRREFTKPGDDYTNREIPEFWNECGRDGSVQKLCGYIKDSAQFKGLLGVCFSTEMTDSGFPYGIGAEYDSESDPQDFEIVEIPAYTYAVSPCAAGCQTRSGRPIERYVPNSSRRAAMNTATALRLRSIPRRTCRTLTIPARYGSQSNRKSKYFFAGARLGSGSFCLEERRKECYTY